MKDNLTDSERLEIWDLLEKPPETALKKITGGRLNGKTDINPQWRLKVMTQTFGPVGIGWRYTIDDLWTAPGDNGQTVAFARVTVYYKYGEEWSQGVPGIGGSMLISKEREGMYTNDEAYKMATTDALSVALKALGVAAAIYEGRYDGSKYNDGPEPTRNPPRKNQSNETPPKRQGLSDEEKAKIESVATDIAKMMKEAHDIGAITNKEYTEMKKRVIEVASDLPGIQKLKGVLEYEIQEAIGNKESHAEH